MTTIRATTFNAAASDSKYKKTVRPNHFMREHGSRQDLLLLQEAGYAIDAARKAGMAVIARKGLAIAYNPQRFCCCTDEPVEQRISAETGARIGIGQQFRDRHTGLVVNVVNVHAGHNAPGNSKERAKKDVIKLQASLGDADVAITGGDFNEMSSWVGFGTLGHGCARDPANAPKTHGMGANDKIGAKGRRVVKAESNLVRKFGSDHTAVELVAHLGNTTAATTAVVCALAGLTAVCATTALLMF